MDIETTHMNVLLHTLQRYYWKYRDASQLSKTRTLVMNIFISYNWLFIF